LRRRGRKTRNKQDNGRRDATPIQADQIHNTNIRDALR
jgi:hypothetical protein